MRSPTNRFGCTHASALGVVLLIAICLQLTTPAAATAGSSSSSSTKNTITRPLFGNSHSHNHNHRSTKSNINPGTTTRTTTNIDPASLKLWFGESVLTAAITYIEPILLASLENITIPDQKISALGITIYLTDMVLVGFNFSEIAVEFSEPSTVSLSMHNLQALATMNWEYTDGPGIDFHGTAVDTISSTQLGIDLLISDNSGGGQLTVSTSLSAHVGSLDIELQGPGSQFFQVIVKMITPIMISVFQDVIKSTISDKINTLISEILAAIPTKVPIDPNGGLPGLYLSYGLIPTPDVHGLSGTYYPGDNSFGGGGSYPVTYQHYDRISIDNYQSYDVSGWYSPLVSGSYTFQLSYDQRAELDINSQSIGSLEMHNPGMCWPEHSQHTTSSMILELGSWYPLRLRYQSGCGGGWVSLSQCDSQGNNCVPIEPLALYTVNNNQNLEIPVTVYSTGGGPDGSSSSSGGVIEMNVAAGTIDVNSTLPSPYHPQPLPSNFILANNTQMIRLELESYIFQSLIWCIDQTLPNGLWLSVTPITLPPAEAEWLLNTTTWKTLLPGLYSAFPDQLFSVFIGPTTTPTITIDPVKGLIISVDATFNISMSPYPIHWGSETVIQIEAKETLAIDLSIRDGSPPTNTNVLTGAITQFTTDTLKLVYSDVPVFNVTDLLPLFNLLTTDVIEPAINKILAKGIPIPVIGPLALSDPVIAYDTGVVAIATDFDFGKTVEQWLLSSSSSSAETDAADY